MRSSPEILADPAASQEEIESLDEKDRLLHPNVSPETVISLLKEGTPYAPYLLDNPSLSLWEWENPSLMRTILELTKRILIKNFMMSSWRHVDGVTLFLCQLTINMLPVWDMAMKQVTSRWRDTPRQALRVALQAVQRANRNAYYESEIYVMSQQADQAAEEIRHQMKVDPRAYLVAYLASLSVSSADERPPPKVIAYGVLNTATFYLGSTDLSIELCGFLRDLLPELRRVVSYSEQETAALATQMLEELN